MTRSNITNGDELLNAMRELGLRQISMVVASKVEPTRLNRFIKSNRPLTADEMKRVRGVIDACKLVEKSAFQKLDGTAIPVDWHRLFQSRHFDPFNFLIRFEQVEKVLD
jgi:hypothetical protein